MTASTVNEGSAFKRCSCTHPDTSKPLAAKCPELTRRNGTWNPKHGTWCYQIELPPTAAGKRRQARRSGMATQTEATTELARIRDLLTSTDDPDIRVQIADKIQHAIKHRHPLPSITEIRRRLASGADLAEEPPTTAQWLTEWITAKQHELAPSTLNSYQGHITNHLTPHLGHIRIDKLTVAHLQAMSEAIDETNDHIRTCRDSPDPDVRAQVRGLRTTGPATKHRIRATLRSALADAIRRPDLPLQVNVASHLRLPPAGREKPLVWTRDRTAQWQAHGTIPSTVMVWTPEQTAQFLDHARTHRLFALWRLLAVRGPRRGEAVGLPWANTRLGDGEIDIRTQIVQIGWRTLTTTPKSSAGDRTITLDTATTTALKTRRSQQNQERLAAGESWHDTGLVFTHPDGTPLHPAQVTKEFHRLAEEAGLPPIRLHDLRHGAASMSMAAGVDPKIVAEELGHATSGFTKDVYQSVYPDTAHHAAEATAALLPTHAP